MPQSKSRLVVPFRGSQPPRWPFRLNRNSRQSEGLLRWYTCQAMPGGLTLFDLSLQREPTAEGTLDATSMWEVGRESDHMLNVSANGVTAGRVGITSGAYTWAIWLEATKVPDTTVVEKAFDNANTSENQMFIWSHNAGAGFTKAAYHRDSGSVYFKAQIASSLAANTKYLICGSWDGSDKLRVYLNGLLEATTTGVASAIAPVGSLLLSVAGSRFPGKIYSFLAWNRLFTDAEVYELFDPHTRYELAGSLNPSMFVAAKKRGDFFSPMVPSGL